MGLDFGKTVHTDRGDSMLNSLWAETQKLPEFPALEQDVQTDVLIIGGGLTGLLCAWELSRAGVDYRLIEADRICHGVSRNTTAKITSQHGMVYHKLIRQFGPEAARRYYEANELALKKYRKLAKTVDCDFETKDNYVYDSADPGKAEKEMEALQQIRVPARYMDSLPLPVPVKGAVVFENQAQFHPLKFAGEIAKGLQIYEKTAAKAFVGNRVLTDRGGITAGKIIVATHFPMLNKHGSYFLKLYQQRSYVLALENAGDVAGMYLDDAKGGFSFRNHGDLLLLGSGGHRTGKESRGWQDLIAFAKQHYPEGREVYHWATQDCMTLDSVPYIGQYSRQTPDLFVATGFCKWGMTTAMVAATVLRDLVQGKENPYAQVFSPSRTMLRPQLFVNGLEAAANLMKFTKPRCPHLGCALKWNPQERSWDCPCHGSRFSREGKLENGPATGDLPK